MTDSTVILHWSGTLTPAKKELSDVEIERRYGSLMQGAVLAFRSDPTYIVEMAESAAALRARRSARKAS